MILGLQSQMRGMTIKMVLESEHKWINQDTQNKIQDECKWVDIRDVGKQIYDDCSIFGVFG